MTTARQGRQSRFVTARRLRRGALTALVAAAALLAASARADDWPVPGLDAAHARLSRERSGATFTDGRWSFAPPGDAGALASPVVSDGYRRQRGARRHGARAGGRHGGARLGGRAGGVGPGNTGDRRWAGVRPHAGGPDRGPGPRRRAAALGDRARGVERLVSGDRQRRHRRRRRAAGTVRGPPRRRDGRSRLAEPARHGRVQQHPARCRGRAGDRGDQRRPLLCVRRHDRASALGLPSPTGSSTSQPRSSPAGASTWRAAPRAIGCMRSTRRRARRLLAGRSVCRSLSPICRGHRSTAGARCRRLPRWAGSSSLRHGSTTRSIPTATACPITISRASWRSHSIRIAAQSPGSTRSPGRCSASPNDVPPFAVCPTPAAFSTISGTALLAVASSLVGTVSVLDAATGNDAGDLTVAGRALASPVMANGRLITVAENGTIEGQLSSVNHPPTAPILAGEPTSDGRGRRDAALVGGDGSRRRTADVRAADRLGRRGAGELRAADLPWAGRDLPGRDGSARARRDLHLRGAGARSARGAVPLVGAGDVHGGDGGDRDGERHAGDEPSGRGGGSTGGGPHRAGRRDLSRCRTRCTWRAESACAARAPAGPRSTRRGWRSG